MAASDPVLRPTVTAIATRGLSLPQRLPLALSASSAAALIRERLGSTGDASSPWTLAWLPAVDGVLRFSVTARESFPSASADRTQLAVTGSLEDDDGGGSVLHFGLSTAPAPLRSREMFWAVVSHVALFILFALAWLPDWLRGQFGIELIFLVAGMVGVGAMLLRRPRAGKNEIDAMGSIYAAIAPHCAELGPGSPLRSRPVT